MSNATEIVNEQRRLANYHEAEMEWAEKCFNAHCDVAEAYEAEGRLDRAETMDALAVRCRQDAAFHREQAHHCRAFLSALRAA